MKTVFLALFVVAVTAAPIPEDGSGSDAVEMIVNGVPDGAALEVGNIVDIKLKEHADGEVVATNLLHPYSAVGIAEIAAAAAAAASNDISVVDNGMAEFARNVHPMPVVIPSPGFEPIEVPKPVIPEPIVMKPPGVPAVEKPQQLPIAAPQVNNEVYNDRQVQVQYNGPQDPGMFSALQDWFQIFVNYLTPASSAPAAAAPEPRHLYIPQH